MPYRYVNPIGTLGTSDYATPREAKEAGIRAGARLKLHQLLNKSQRERDVLWSLLEDQGWSVRWV